MAAKKKQTKTTKRKLTAKQKAFADEYIKTSNATESAKKAGYSPKTAYAIGGENLNKPEIKAYIDERMAQLASKRIMGADEILEMLSGIARGEIKEEVVISAIDGVNVVKKTPSLKERIAAGKELLKRYPSNDRLTDAQVRKLEADAQIAEYNARNLIGDVDDSGKVTILDDMSGVGDE